jgi:hypothetical protein
MSLTSSRLLQDVANRIIARWLVQKGRADVRVASGQQSSGGRTVHVTYAWQGGEHRIMVKPDTYFGVDPSKTRDRSLSFYREDASLFAFEAVANAATREPGWVFESPADEIYYYYLVIAQTEDEIRALMGEPDEVFFSELAVDRDELVVIPMAAVRRWFEANYERFTSRPVITGGASAWYRLVPRADLEGAVPEITVIGRVFRTLL